MPAPNCATREARRIRRQEGAALLVAMLLLALMGVIGLASLNTVMRDRQVAGFQSQSQTALYAADAGLAEGLNVLRLEVVGAALTPGDCLTGTISNQTLPNGASYAAEAGTGICMLASADPCSELDASWEQQSAVYLNTIWDVRSVGTASGGARARVQAGAERCHAFSFNY
jgi:Tfp pilus assembly protein PilX